MLTCCEGTGWEEPDYDSLTLEPVQIPTIEELKLQEEKAMSLAGDEGDAY